MKRNRWENKLSLHTKNSQGQTNSLLIEIFLQMENFESIYTVKYCDNYF